MALQWHISIFCKIEGHDQFVAPESPSAVRFGSVPLNLAMGLRGDSGRGAGSAEPAIEAPHTIAKRAMHINELVIAVHGLLVGKIFLVSCRSVTSYY